MQRKGRLVWCVKDRHGCWCAAKGNREPEEGVTSVETKCGHVVVLPWGIDKRVPSCSDCGKQN